MAAAEKLITLIRRIGWRLYAQGYTEQTASQKSLIEALAEPEYVEAVTAINAPTWVNNLQTSNADFERILTLKNEVMARGGIPTAKECKQRMLRYLKPLLTYLELMDTIDPGAYTSTTAKNSRSD